MANKKKKAQLILENGKRFDGKLIGYDSSTVGEVIFCTSMTGYQELITDPSMADKIIVMTYPLIGNYGMSLDDMESDIPYINGLIVKELCDSPSNWRCEIELETYLEENHITGMEGVDTRALTKFIRNEGNMKGFITTDFVNLSDEEINKIFDEFNAKTYKGKEKYTIEGEGPHIAFLDLGTKQSVIKEFTTRGCKVTVLPCDVEASEFFESKVDALFVSNGPENLDTLNKVSETIKAVIGKLPVMAIGFGFNALSVAMGANCVKMKFGHNGANHPVKKHDNDRVYITSQGHGFTITNLPAHSLVTYTNINDNSVEGIKHKHLNLSGVQFIPETVTGPLNTGFIYDEFIASIERRPYNA